MVALVNHGGKIGYKPEYPKGSTSPIDGNVSMDTLVINCLSALSLGMILFLIASGLSLVMGTMGIANLAHGALYMVGAYVGVTVITVGGNFWFAALMGGVAAGLVALLIERVFLRHLYKQINEQVLLTFGFVYILTNATLWIWGPWPKIGTAPSFLSGSISIGELGFPIYRFVVIVIGLMIAIGLWLLQEKTRVGAMIRAGMDDKEMTTGLGINYELISAVVFSLGVFIAGFAGAIATPILGASLGSSIDVLTLALSVVIVGGMGSVQGALVGAILIGLTDNFGKAFFPEFAMFTIYLVMIIMLLFRPSGLLTRM